MSVNGIGAGYQTTGYETSKIQRNVTERNFVDLAAETALEKTAQDKIDYEERAFESIAPNAPEEVKQAWMGAAKEAGVNGLGMQKNGMLSHISQMMVERVERSWNGGDPNDILGSTAVSALRAAKQALYDLDHPLAYTPKSLEVQQAKMKEREFYQAFIRKLEQL